MDNSGNFNSFMGFRLGHQLHIGWIYPLVACACDYCCSYSSDSGTKSALESEKSDEIYESKKQRLMTLL